MDNLTTRNRARVRDLVPPNFFAMTDQEQLHVLAVAIVASERYHAVRELLLTARVWRSGPAWSPKPVWRSYASAAARLEGR